MINSFKVTVNGRYFGDRATMPILWQNHLDERLDEAKMNFVLLPVEVIPPMSKIEVEATNDTNTTIQHYSWLVASDSAIESPVGSGKYKHSCNLIEETKLLEGFMVDALTFTNNLGRNYTKGAYFITPESWQIDEVVKQYVFVYKSPQKSGETFTTVGVENIFKSLGLKNFVGQYTNVVIFKDGVEVHRTEFKQITDANWKDFQGPTYTIDTLNGNTYRIEYHFEFEPAFPSNTQIISYTINVVSNAEPLPLYTVTDVINRVLEVAETRLEGTAPRFKLNEAQAEQLSKINAPEFAFTKATLKEILDQIGGFIHGIPRLKDGVIYYDMLGGTEVAELSRRGKAYVSKLASQNIESYATSLDSNVDNLVNILNPTEGVITEPYYDGYKTVRTEDVYARISETDMAIITQYPIQEIKSLKCGFVNNETVGGDLTPYVFEQAEYSRLSSFEGLYPNSKAYAIYYTQGQNNIKGLTFKVPSVGGEVFKRYSIVNIIKATCGVDLGENWNPDYTTLAFQITYIPIFNARLSQCKQYIGDNFYPRTLAYNQSANLVETRYYGENIKGVIARMGNAERTMTFNIEDVYLIPKPGQLWDEDGNAEYYVASVAVEAQPFRYRVTVELSKDFNRLSQYVGINSVRRFYEVSEKQAYARDILYTDYLVVGDEVESDATLISPKAINAIKDIFVQNDTDSADITMVAAQGFSEGVGLNTVLLPVNSIAMGDAMVLNFRYEDNYSAGLQSRAVSPLSGVVGTFTNAVAYCDYYGRMDTLKLNYYTRRDAESSFSQQTAIGNALPLTDTTSGDGIISTPQNLIIKKNGSEILAFNYTMEFVTNRRNIILGSTLSRNCSMVRGRNDGHSAKLYLMRNRLSKFADVVDLSNATEIADYGADLSKITISGQQIKIADEVSPGYGVAWAIVDNASGELLIGCNMQIAQGETLFMPYITAKHNIF